MFEFFKSNYEGENINYLISIDRLSYTNKYMTGKACSRAFRDNIICRNLISPSIMSHFCFFITKNKPFNGRSAKKSELLDFFPAIFAREQAEALHYFHFHNK